MSDSIMAWDARHAKFIEREVAVGRWRAEIIPKQVSGTPRDMQGFHARRTADLIKHQWHGDKD
jgi:hypothetical protein